MLEIGKRYKTGWGKIEEVAGPTKSNPEWVWTLQGNWFRQSDGRAIRYDQVRGHEPVDHPSNRDLQLTKNRGRRK